MSEVLFMNRSREVVLLHPGIASLSCAQGLAAWLGPRAPSGSSDPWVLMLSIVSQCPPVVTLVYRSDECVCMCVSSHDYKHTSTF